MQPATVRTCMRVAICLHLHGRWIDGPSWDDLNNLGHLGHFSVSQVGFIHMQNKFSGCDLILCTCSLENSVGVRGKCMSELNLGLFNALKYHCMV